MDQITTNILDEYCSKSRVFLKFGYELYRIGSTKVIVFLRQFKNVGSSNAGHIQIIYDLMKITPYNVAKVVNWIQ